jgi:hypothetical protein
MPLTFAIVHTLVLYLTDDPIVLLFVTAVISEQVRWLFVTESITELLGMMSFVMCSPPCSCVSSSGYEPRDVIGRPALELVHPEEFPAIRRLH